MKDQSIFKQTSDAVNQDGLNEYANELIKEVWLGLLVTIGGAGIVSLSLMILDGAFD